MFNLTVPPCRWYFHRRAADHCPSHRAVCPDVGYRHVLLACDVRLLQPRNHAEHSAIVCCHGGVRGGVRYPCGSLPPSHPYLWHYGVHRCQYVGTSNDQREVRQAPTAASEQLGIENPKPPYDPSWNATSNQASNRCLAGSFGPDVVVVRR